MKRWPEFDRNGDLPVGVHMEDCQIKRDRTRRGIVEVIINDQKRQGTRRDSGANSTFQIAGRKASASRDEPAELPVVGWGLPGGNRSNESGRPRILHVASR